MNTQDTPDYFQQEDGTALRQRAQWLDDKLGLDSHFLSKVLHEQEATINAWRKKGAPLPAPSEDILRELWRVVLHLLSHYNNEEQRVRQLLEQTIPESPQPKAAPAPVERASRLFPPWFHSSLKSHLEARGVDAIAEVNHWVMSLRFGDSYATSPKATTWS
jgi:hypothetical protein